MLAPSASVLHFTVPLQFVAVSVAVSPVHSSVLLLLICGTAGVGIFSIVILFDDVLVPQSFVHVAV